LRFLAGESASLLPPQYAENKHIASDDIRRLTNSSIDDVVPVLPWSAGRKKWEVLRLGVSPFEAMLVDLQ
jgi:hypothetical protein